MSDGVRYGCIAGLWLGMWLLTRIIRGYELRDEKEAKP